MLLATSFALRGPVDNLAAQVANPADLIGPRKQSPIDAENRMTVIDLYRTRGVWKEFSSNSEVSY